MVGMALKTDIHDEGLQEGTHRRVRVGRVMTDLAIPQQQKAAWEIFFFLILCAPVLSEQPPSAPVPGWDFPRGDLLIGPNILDDDDHGDIPSPQNTQATAGKKR